jgi:hypothetical protein
MFQRSLLPQKPGRSWIFFDSNSASDILGRPAGATLKFVSYFPNVIAWHCNKNRLELAVSDTVRGISVVYFVDIL